MQLKTVLLSALLSGLPATLANPISEVRAPGELHKSTKHGNNKGGNGNGHGNGNGNGNGNGHGNGNGNGNGNGSGGVEVVDLGPWWSVRGFSRHWNATTKSVELSFAIWDSRDNSEVDCNVNAPIPDGQNYKFAEFHSLPCSKNDPVGARKWLISMGYVEYFDAGIMNICDSTVDAEGSLQASAWFDFEGINRPKEHGFRNIERVPVGWTDFGCVYNGSPYPL